MAAKGPSPPGKLRPVRVAGAPERYQPLLRRTQAVPLRPRCARLLQAPLHHGFGELFLGLEVVVDIAYRHASRLGDVCQGGLSETALIREPCGGLNQPCSLVRLWCSHVK